VAREGEERKRKSIDQKAYSHTYSLSVPPLPAKNHTVLQRTPTTENPSHGEMFGFRRWNELRWLERSWLRDLSKSSGAVASSSSFSFALSLVARSPPHHHQLTLSRPSSTPTTTKCAPLSRSLARSTDLPTVTRRASKLRSDHSSISPLQHHRHHRQIHPPPCRLKEAKEAIAFQRE